MKILLTLEEYAKHEGLSISAIRKRVSSNSPKILTIDKVSYVLEDDALIKSLKQNITKKNGQIRELKLKLELKNTVNDERFIEELQRQIRQKDEKFERLESKIDSLQEKKDEAIEKLQKEHSALYEKFLGELFKTKSNYLMN